MTTTTTSNLKTTLASLVHGAKTGRTPNAADYLGEMLRAAEQDGRRADATMIRLALRHATR